MTRKKGIFLSIAGLLLFSLLFFIIFGEYGYIDLTVLKTERDQLVEKKELLKNENISLSIEIDRLKNDPEYIENIARHELGMVAEDELILKPQTLPQP
jgi:cell division protein FtsB